MPEQSYSIGFGPNDFFYSYTKEEKILQTIPFDISNLIKWCQSRNPSLEITDNDRNNTSLLFQSKISDIILDPVNRDDFVNKYMPGNVYINNNFNSIALNLMASDVPSVSNSAPITGNIVIDTNNSSIPTMNLDISAGSTLNYSTQGSQWNKDISLNAMIKNSSMLEYNPPAGALTNSDGTVRKITVSGTTRNPRCKFVNNCTENHAHFDSCTTQTFVDKNTGQSYCKCVCTGTIKFNATPHSHCNEINLEDTRTNGLDANWVNQYKSNTTLTTVLKNIKLNLNANFLKSSTASNIDGKMVANYANATELIKTDSNIRNLIYDYYMEVIDNKYNQQKLLDNNTFNNTASLIHKDATRTYKKQYLELFNITAGIFLASTYLYVLLKK